MSLIDEMRQRLREQTRESEAVEVAARTAPAPSTASASADDVMPTQSEADVPTYALLATAWIRQTRQTFDELRRAAEQHADDIDLQLALRRAAEMLESNERFIRRSAIVLAAEPVEPSGLDTTRPATVTLVAGAAESGKTRHVEASRRRAVLSGRNTRHFTALDLPTARLVIDDMAARGRRDGRRPLFTIELDANDEDVLDDLAYVLRRASAADADIIVAVAEHVLRDRPECLAAADVVVITAYRQRLTEAVMSGLLGLLDSRQMLRVNEAVARGRDLVTINRRVD